MLHKKGGKKHKRIKSQECINQNVEYSWKITLTVNLANEQATIILEKGIKMSEVNRILKKQFGENCFFLSEQFNCDFDYCLEEGLGTLQNSMEIREQRKEKDLDVSNNLRAYIIYGCISVGGFSYVFPVRCRKTGKFYAGKFIDKGFYEDKQKFNLFIENERKINEELDHPFVVKMHNFIETMNYFIFILDYCPAGELFTLMKKHRDMKEEEARFYFIQTVLAIDHLHQKNIIYRDIKPENILLDKMGHIKIADFGLAKVMRKKTNSYCGSLEYMAPEIVQGAQYSFQIDYYCLGSLLFELMVGCPPFYNPNFSPCETKHHIVNTHVQFPSRKDFSENFKDLVTKLLDKDQNSRLGTKNGIMQILNHPWVGKFDRHKFQNAQITPPYHVSLSKSNFQKEYLPNQQIEEAIAKISEDIFQIEKYQNLKASQFKKSKMRKNSLHDRKKQKSLSSSKKNQICQTEEKQKNRMVLKNFLNYHNVNRMKSCSKGKRRTKSSQNFFTKKNISTNNFLKCQSLHKRTSHSQSKQTSPLKLSVKQKNPYFSHKFIKKYISILNKNQSKHLQNRTSFFKTKNMKLKEEMRDKYESKLQKNGNKLKKNGTQQSKQNIFQSYRNSQGKRNQNQIHRISDCFS